MCAFPSTLVGDFCDGDKSHFFLSSSFKQAACRPPCDPGMRSLQVSCGHSIRASAAAAAAEATVSGDHISRRLESTAPCSTTAVARRACFWLLMKWAVRFLSCDGFVSPLADRSFITAFASDTHNRSMYVHMHEVFPSRHEVPNEGHRPCQESHKDTCLGSLVLMSDDRTCSATRCPPDARPRVRASTYSAWRPENKLRNSWVGLPGRC